MCLAICIWFKHNSGFLHFITFSLLFCCINCLQFALSKIAFDFRIYEINCVLTCHKSNDFLFLEKYLSNKIIKLYGFVKQFENINL